jgi:hypothetical protein
LKDVDDDDAGYELAGRLRRGARLYTSLFITLLGVTGDRHYAGSAIRMGPSLLTREALPAALVETWREAELAA